MHAPLGARPAGQDKGGASGRGGPAADLAWHACLRARREGGRGCHPALDLGRHAPDLEVVDNPPQVVLVLLVRPLDLRARPRSGAAGADPARSPISQATGASGCCDPLPCGPLCSPARPSVLSRPSLYGRPSRIFVVRRTPTALHTVSAPPTPPPAARPRNATAGGGRMQGRRKGVAGGLATLMRRPPGGGVCEGSRRNGVWRGGWGRVARAAGCGRGGGGPGR